MNVLFLCTGNSARSIMAECYLNHVAQGRMCAFSAGSVPTGRVNPIALDTLRRHCVPAHNVRSKSWDEFATGAALRMDLIITVCNNAAGEICPVWPGAPLKAHWSMPDPLDAAMFDSVFGTIRQAIDGLLDVELEGEGTQVSRRISALVPL